MKKKRIVILGSTGSIGTRTLEVISSLPGRFEVVGLTGKKEIDILERQIREYHPKVVAVLEGAEELEKRVRGRGVKILSGEEGLLEVAKYKEADLVVAAIAGASSLILVLEAIRAGKTIALASKEAMVMAGKLIREEADRNKVKILPVDSEHNAIFQCLQGEKIRDVKRLILTASGGPFYNRSREALRSEERRVGKEGRSRWSPYH